MEAKTEATPLPPAPSTFWQQSQELANLHLSGSVRVLPYEQGSYSHCKLQVSEENTLCSLHTHPPQASNSAEQLSYPSC